MNKLNKTEKNLIKRWKECYRDMLDSWGMWGERCEFDVRSGEIQRSLASNEGGHGHGHGHAGKEDGLGVGGMGERCPV